MTDYFALVDALAIWRNRCDYSFDVRQHQIRRHQLALDMYRTHCELMEAVGLEVR